MDGRSAARRLGGLDRPLGDAHRALVLGGQALAITGLSRRLARGLDARWGGFVAAVVEGPPCLELRVLRAGPPAWLALERAGEPYRIEAFDCAGEPGIASYHFALAREGPRTFRVGLTDQAQEPAERVMDNVLRCLAARLAVDRGGFALHASGVLREGRAYLFAGPSGAGKSTAVRLAAPAPSLGDDFGLVVEAEGDFLAWALPFDNSERVAGRPTGGAFPVAGIFRLHRAAQTRVESPPPALAVASLMACAAFPWALPDLAERLLAQVARFVAAGRFRHLHLALGPDLWTHLAG
jgi:hypothetical protein